MTKDYINSKYIPSDYVLSLSYDKSKIVLKKRISTDPIKFEIVGYMYLASLNNILDQNKFYGHFMTKNDAYNPPIVNHHLDDY